MTQMAAGVAYLHENLNFLKNFFETSAMSTDAGTLAFKAPEFFQKTKERKLVYHRNVNVYAARLTFLASHQGKGERSN